MNTTEVLVAAVLARLQADLPARLTAAGLPAVLEWLEYYPSHPQPAKSPQCWVEVCQEHRDSHLAGGGSLAGAGSRYGKAHTVLVGITSAANTELVVNQQVRGLANCIRVSIEANATAWGTAGQASWVLWQSTDYSPVFAEGSSLFRLAVLTFEATVRVAMGGAQ